MNDQNTICHSNIFWIWHQKKGAHLGWDATRKVHEDYSVTIKHHMHEEQAAFQESEYFKEKARERYKIEAKNSELKHRHGYDIASASGLFGMQL